LEDYSVKIVDCPGSQYGKPDALSWHPEYCPEKVPSEVQLITRILSQKYFSLNTEEYKDLISASMLSKRWVNWNKEFFERVKIDGVKDKKYK
jgi:hypothetical protein